MQTTKYKELLMTDEQKQDNEVIKVSMPAETVAATKERCIEPENIAKKFETLVEKSTKLSSQIYLASKKQTADTIIMLLGITCLLLVIFPMLFYLLLAITTFIYGGTYFWDRYIEQKTSDKTIMQTIGTTSNIKVVVGMFCSFIAIIFCINTATGNQYNFPQIPGLKKETGPTVISVKRDLLATIKSQFKPHVRDQVTLSGNKINFTAALRSYNDPPGLFRRREPAKWIMELSKINIEPNDNEMKTHKVQLNFRIIKNGEPLIAPSQFQLLRKIPFFFHQFLKPGFYGKRSQKWTWKEQ